MAKWYLHIVMLIKYFFPLFTRHRGLSCSEIHYTRGKTRDPGCHSPRSGCDPSPGGWHWNTADIPPRVHCMRQHRLQETALWLWSATINWTVCSCLPLYRGMCAQSRLPFIAKGERIIAQSDFSILTYTNSARHSLNLFYDGTKPEIPWCELSWTETQPMCNRRDERHTSGDLWAILNPQGIN